MHVQKHDIAIAAVGQKKPGCSKCGHVHQKERIDKFPWNLAAFLIQLVVDGDVAVQFHTAILAVRASKTNGSGYQG